ncbi:ribonuclease M5 [Hujiaoplasma nucleasis]|uniref:Ribonuclease M5 n=1 Tax=Hujiaoplasma nucleasis TaxID=2725268 RepID=A0A7L6N4I4_9MOLU|nr:ribonuclease M5 [Hujiaoplasma nucleasis]QLY40471.1 ribonuclease M5 [Hujiaoplasma nucleasis]
MSRSQVIVVEGYHDQIKVNQVFPNLPVIVTNGSEISEETLNAIYQASLENEVILFLDPDYPGQQIMNKILSTGGRYSIASMSKDKAISKNNKKVGIEHATKDDVYEALVHKLTMKQKRQTIFLKDLMVRKLANSIHSRNLRKKVCESLHIPFSNAKTLLKYLNLLNISLERIDEILNES